MRNYVGSLIKRYLPVEEDPVSSGVLDIPESALTPKPLSSQKITIPVLEFLWGRPWDEHALAVVSALQPEYLLATYGEVKTIGVFGRAVYVFLRDQQVIDYIELDAPADMREDLIRVNTSNATDTIGKYLHDCGVSSVYQYAKNLKREHDQS